MQNVQINGVSYDVKLVVADGYIQGDCEPNNRGCLADSKEVEATGVGKIRVTREDLLPILARSLGASINGASLPTGVTVVSDKEYDLDVTFYNDTPVIKPKVNMDMAPQLAGGWVHQVGEQNVIIKNAIMLATRFYDGFKANADKVSKVTFTAGTDVFRDKLTEVKTKLNKGDLKNNIRIFRDSESRILCVPDAETEFCKSSGFLAGGSNDAQTMLRNGTIDAKSMADFQGSGYKGTFLGLPVNLYSEDKLIYADKCLGFPEGTIEKTFIAYVANSAGNLYGYEDGGVKLKDLNLGNGLIIEPDYRFGAAVISPKANSWLCPNNYVNPYDFYGLSGVAALNVKPCIKPLASRVQLEVVPSETVAATGTTATVYALTKDNMGNTIRTPFTGKLYWYAKATAPADLQAFITDAKDASVTKKGVVNVSSGTATISGSSIAGKFHMIAFDPVDGTMSEIASSVAIA